MDGKKEDNRTEEKILSDMRKKQANGEWYIGKVMSDCEMKNANKQIVNYNNKITAKERKKSDKKFNKSMRNKPYFLISIADLLQRLFHIIVTLFSMAGLLNILFAWQIYKAISSDGWQAIFQTKYSLFVVIYFLVLFVLKQVYYALYRYAKE